MTSGNVLNEAENLVSSPEKSLEAKGLKDGHLTQVVNTSQDSSQDSSQGSTKDSSSWSANLVSPSNKILGANDLKAKHLTQAVETFGNFANTILGFQIDSTLNRIPSSIASDESYIDVSNRDKVNLALANFQNLGVKGKVIY